MNSSQLNTNAPPWLVVLCMGLFLTTTACGGSGSGESGSSGEPQELLAVGSYSTTLESDSVTLDYDGMVASAVVNHKISSTPDGYACITEASVSVAKEDGSCAFELKYRPGFEGEGLVLRNAEFHAKKGITQDGVVIDTIPCTDWPTESASGEVIYSMSEGEGSINLSPIAAPGSTQSEVSLTGATLKPSGNVTMKFRAPGSAAKEFSLDLSELSFQGDVVSTGVSEGACARYFESYPEWELTDVNETSPFHNETFGLHRFKGKIVVVLLSAAW